MPEVIINEIPVNFPFEPYDVQKEYMCKVLECLQKGVNGVLESPTGTGKTLSLLCSSLAWLEIKKAQIQATYQIAASGGEEKDNVLFQLLAKTSGITKLESQVWNILAGMPKIIYASRTHSQLGQVVAELKRTKYTHFKVAVLGSRDQLCLHPEVSKETNIGIKTAMCRAKISTRTCHYYNNVEVKKIEPGFSEIMDIEDLVTKSRKAQCCPYYLSRELQKNADIIFVPYNYLLDARVRKLMDLQLANNVIILDEAHNVEKMCEESASFQLTSTDIALCMSEVTQVMKEMHEQMTSASFDDSGVARDFTADDLCILKAMFTELEDAVDKIDLSSGIKNCGFDPNSLGAAFPGSYVFDILAKAEVTADKLHILSEVIHNVAQYIVTTSGNSYQHKGAGLQKFEDFLKVLNNSLGPERNRDRTDMFYKVYIEPEVSKKAKSDAWTTKVVTKGNAKIIHLWCFSAGCGMKSLQEQGVRCIILTSGTLSPLDATISEIGIPVDVSLENPHIVKGDQVCVSVVARGPTNTELKSTYENRNKTEYLKELGLTLQNFSRIIPDGLLVFFPSYPTMDLAVNFWQQEGLWTKINNNKMIFVEPQRREVLNEVINKYYEKINEQNSRGAILLAVCRGKVSEGLDFADCKGRAVIITGLPYPPFKDARVVLKRQFLDQNRNDKQSYSGMEWYQLEATRAVNQAVGRVIRHAKDFGAIILCDSRFGSMQTTKSLSKWLRPHIKNCKFGFAVSSLASFFRNANSLASLKQSAVNPGASFSYNAEIVSRRMSPQKQNSDDNENNATNLVSHIQKIQEVQKLNNPSSQIMEPVEYSKPIDLLGALDSLEKNNSSVSSQCTESSSKNNKINLGFLPSGFSEFLCDDIDKNNTSCLSPSLTKKRLLQNQYEVSSSPSSSSGHQRNRLSEINTSPSSTLLYGSNTKKRKVIVVNKSNYNSVDSSTNNITSSYITNTSLPQSSSSSPDISVTKMKTIAYWFECPFSDVSPQPYPFHLKLLSCCPP
ncbi:regulator of telomere elongation helicase 1 homolog isoform X2 [Lycorma delicatula]|uniref:regulator of telomere elongation helicase 1 homolog isoform X2 n=1 Tax=Lycorma delicatula TaxID=130591 RepID=UPI003F516D32